MRYIDKQTLIEVHNAYDDLILGNNELALKQLYKILSNEQLNLHVVNEQRELLYEVCDEIEKATNTTKYEEIEEDYDLQDCPNCGSDVVGYDGTDSVPFLECFQCDHNWIP